MNIQDRIRQLANSDHTPFFQRPHVSRRHFFQLIGAGVTGSMLLNPRITLAADAPQVTTQNKAKNVIFILLTGAPSHTDTFDFKRSPDTPSSIQSDTIGGLAWPTSLLPKMAAQLPNLAIVRSVRAWALVHSLSQTWVQIGRNPAAALGDIAPNIGSVVAIEKDPERRPSAAEALRHAYFTRDIPARERATTYASVLLLMIVCRKWTGSGMSSSRSSGDI